MPLESSTELGQAFEPRRDVQSIPEDVVVFDLHVALVNADAELDTVVRRYRGSQSFIPRLPLGRAAQYIERSQISRACAGILHGTRMALLDVWIN